MIVWGGYSGGVNGNQLNTGGKYNPETDSWTSTSTTNAKKSNPAHTITWYCVDMNDMWKVSEPVIIGFGNLVGNGPCSGTTPFPVTVPSGQRFMPGGAFVWIVNKTYPAGYAEAVAAAGFTFAPHSNSPAEDFKSKISEIRVEVITFPEGDPVAVFRFDGQKNIKLVQWGDIRGTNPPFDPIDDPALNIHLSSAEVERLPMYGFTVKAGPVPAGEYFACVFWTLSADTWDGLGVLPPPGGNVLPAGEFLYGCNRFRVAP